MEKVFAFFTKNNETLYISSEIIYRHLKKKKKASGLSIDMAETASFSMCLTELLHCRQCSLCSEV